MLVYYTLSAEIALIKQPHNLADQTSSENVCPFESIGAPPVDRYSWSIVIDPKHFV